MALTQRSRTVLTLYSARNCLDCHRVRLVLNAKSLAYECVIVQPDAPPEDFLDLSPYASVPMLVDRDLALYDLNVICEYLDERYPHPPLLPIDPIARARMRLAMARIERDWLIVARQIFSTPRLTSTLCKQLVDALTTAIPLFKAAKFFLSTEFSMADCMLAPLIWRLSSLKIVLPREAHIIYDYGDRIFRNPCFLRSLTAEEKVLNV